jgi:hypothetical protein
MKKIWEIVQDIIVCGLPFIFANYLCSFALPDLGAGMRMWEPAFYSYLPMCFLFVSAIAFMNRLELRQLRALVTQLREAKALLPPS